MRRSGRKNSCGVGGGSVTCGNWFLFLKILNEKWQPLLIVKALEIVFLGKEIFSPLGSCVISYHVVPSTPAVVYL